MAKSKWDEMNRGEKISAILGGVGRGISGAVAPFVGDYTWADRMNASLAEQEYRKWQMEQAEEKNMMDLYSKTLPTKYTTMNEKGEPVTYSVSSEVPKALQERLDEWLDRKYGGTVPPTMAGTPSVGGLPPGMAAVTQGGKTKFVNMPKDTSGDKVNAELQEKYGQASRVVGAFRNLMGYAQNVEDTFVNPITGEKGAGAIAGLVAGVANNKLAPGQLQEYARPLQQYVAQQEETKISSLPILSGQARYVVDLAKAIDRTIPSVDRTYNSKRDLIGQSVRNMMTMVYGIENGFFAKDKLKKLGIDPNDTVQSADEQSAQKLLSSVKLTKEQEAAINNAIDYVLGGPKLGKDSKPVEGFSDDDWGAALKAVKNNGK